MKYKIGEIISCNRTLFKILYEQKRNVSMSDGFKLYELMKIFDDVEEYVFDVMTATFGQDIDYSRLTEEQKEVYFNLMNVEIDLEFEKMKKEVFEKDDKTIINMEDIDNLKIMLE